MRKIWFASFAALLVSASTASAMVTISKHNFTSSLSGQNTVYLSDPDTKVNGEVCVFCHTPHGGDTAQPSAPLWNRAMAAGGAYTPYYTSTIDSPYANTDRQPKGVSLACLSCHDGTIALDSLRNVPGSGNYDTTAASRAWGTWLGLGGTQTAGGANSLPEDGRVTNLTRDLSGQHPISIEYAKYGASTYDSAFYTPDGGPSSSGLRWFNEGGGQAGKAEDNEVKLFATNGDTKVYVECASCHNPHGTEGATPGTNISMLLRKSNNQSALCTTCHIK